MAEKIIILYFLSSLCAFFIHFITLNRRFPFSEILKSFITELPIVQISQDEYFHELKNPEKDMRFSFLYIPMGIYKFYLFTYSEVEGWSLIKILSLLDRHEKEKDKIENKLRRITTKSWQKVDLEDIADHLDFLKDRCQYYMNVKNTANIKGTFYITIIAAVISVYLGKIDQLGNLLEENLLTIFGLSVIFLYLTNITILLLSFIGVKGYELMKYSTFRDEYENPKKGLYDYWYTRFQRLQVYARSDTDFILNAENYIKLLFVWFAITAFIQIN